MSNKKIAGSSLGFVVSTTHAMMCPVHGILPLAAKAGLGGGAALSEYKILKPFAWLHEKEEQGIDYLLKKIDPIEINYKEDHSNLESTIGHSHEHHNDFHPYTSQIVSGANYTVMAISAIYLGKSLYRKFLKNK